MLWRHGLPRHPSLSTWCTYVATGNYNFQTLADRPTLCQLISEIRHRVIRIIMAMKHHNIATRTEGVHPYSTRRICCYPYSQSLTFYICVLLPPFLFLRLPPPLAWQPMLAPKHQTSRPGGQRHSRGKTKNQSTRVIGCLRVISPLRTASATATRGHSTKYSTSGQNFTPDPYTHAGLGQLPKKNTSPSDVVQAPSTKETNINGAARRGDEDATVVSSSPVFDESLSSSPVLPKSLHSASGSTHWKPLSLQTWSKESVQVHGQQSPPSKEQLALLFFNVQ